MQLALYINPEYNRPVLVVTPSAALTILAESTDKRFGSALNKPTVPTDTIEVLQYRAGALAYRNLLLKEIHASGDKGITAGLSERH